MNRNGLTVPLVAVLARVPPASLLAVLAGVALALVLGACGSGSSGSHSAASPACLPATLTHSAKLDGVPVNVSPTPDTDTANPHTQISFPGRARPQQIHRDVSVVGLRKASPAATLDTSLATRRATARASSPIARSPPASA